MNTVSGDSTATGARAANTAVETLSSNNRFALLQLKPTSGRKHQLRLVCSQILKAPIVGDFKYGYKDEKVDGHLLHCYQLEFQVSRASSTLCLCGFVPELTINFADLAEIWQNGAYQSTSQPARQLCRIREEAWSKHCWASGVPQNLTNALTW